MSDERNKKKDLTNLHELSEFIHEEDPALNKLLKTHTDLKTNHETEESDDEAPMLESDDILGSSTDPEIKMEELESSAFPDEIDNNPQEQNFIEESPVETFAEEFSSTDFASEETPPEPVDFSDQAFDQTFDEAVPEFEVPQVATELPPVNTEKVSTEVTPKKEERKIELSKKATPPTLTKNDFVQELKHFMNQYDIGVIKREGNPPFSLLIEEIKTKSQKAEIKKILLEYKIVTEAELADYEKQLEYECLFLTHLSEYSAIFLADKIRKLKVRLKFGLSGNIRESEHYERDDYGIIGPKQIDQNHESHQNLKQTDLREWVLITNHMSVPDYSIVEYLGIGQQNYYFDKKDLLRLKGQNSGNIKTPEYLTNFFNEHIDQDYLSFKLRFKDELNLIFEGLVERLRENAEQKGANALLGIQFQVHQLNAKEEAFMMHTTATLVVLKKK